MARSSSRPLTAEVLQDEVRFLLKTLLRDDLFGSHVALTEAEKLLESSLSVDFVEYCAFLKRQGFIEIDREKNSVHVLERGKEIARRPLDDSLLAKVQSHFAPRLDVVPHDSPVHTGESPIAEEVYGDRYSRYEAIGQGTLGTVFRASHLRLGQSVVLKEMQHVFDLVTYIERSELLRRIQAAVLAQAKLSHPHILRVVDVEFQRDPPFVVLDYAEGGSLKDRMFRAKQNPAAEGQHEGVLATSLTLRLFCQVASALEYAHREGCLHGDLKPENILFDVRGNVLLSDFGAAQVTRHDDGSAPVYVGTGTPSYMSPEQLHQGEVGPATDVYAMGILLYQLLTGALPGRRSKMPSEVNPTVPSAIDDIFDKMTTDSLAERYQDFSAVLDDLYAAVDEKEIFRRDTLLLSTADPFPPPSVDEEWSTEGEGSASAEGPPADLELADATDARPAAGPQARADGDPQSEASSLEEDSVFEDRSSSEEKSAEAG